MKTSQNNNPQPRKKVKSSEKELPEEKNVSKKRNTSKKKSYPEVNYITETGAIKKTRKKRYTKKKKNKVDFKEYLRKKAKAAWDARDAVIFVAVMLGGPCVLTFHDQLQPGQ